MILQYGKNHKIGKFDSQCHKTIHKIRKFVLCSVSQFLAITKNYIYGKQMWQSEKPHTAMGALQKSRG